MEENQVNAEPGIVDTKASLSTDKGEIVPELEKKIRQSMDQRGFQVGLRVLILKI